MARYTRFSGGNVIWFGTDEASVIARAQFFGVPVAGGTTFDDARTETAAATDASTTTHVTNASITETAIAEDTIGIDTIPSGFVFPTVDLSEKRSQPFLSGSVRLTRATAARYDQGQTRTVR